MLTVLCWLLLFPLLRVRAAEGKEKFSSFLLAGFFFFFILRANLCKSPLVLQLQQGRRWDGAQELSSATKMQ